MFSLSGMLVEISILPKNERVGKSGNNHSLAILIRTWVTDPIIIRKSDCTDLPLMEYLCSSSSAFSAKHWEVALPVLCNTYCVV